jgi:hypothetical protein
VHDLLGAVGIFEAQMGAMATKVSETLTYMVSCSISSINIVLILLNTKVLTLYLTMLYAQCACVSICQSARVIPFPIRPLFIHAVYCALGICHLCEKSIARIGTTGCFARTHFYWNRDTRREHTALSNGLVIPFDLSGCDENSLLNCTNSAANKPHGKMTVKCDTLHLHWSLTALHNYPIMPHCATQIFPLCRNVLHKLTPRAAICYINYPTVPHCTTQITPLCHTVLHKISPCATLYYTNYSLVPHCITQMISLCHNVLYKLSPYAVDITVRQPDCNTQAGTRIKRIRIPKTDILRVQIHVTL